MIIWNCTHLPAALEGVTECFPLIHFSPLYPNLYSSTRVLVVDRNGAKERLQLLVTWLLRLDLGGVRKVVILLVLFFPGGCTLNLHQRGRDFPLVEKTQIIPLASLSVLRRTFSGSVFRGDDALAKEGSWRRCCCY